MKKALKIILPILLVIAVIGCMIWYLFVYDRDFTRDVLLYQARFFERQGNSVLAAWFYDQAYSQANQDEDVAIELAEQYKSQGNYTKAEFTLSNAIADGGTAKLYIALCKTYVEQNKLLDAVEMLNNVADPAIREELDAMRPPVPTADPAPGFYTAYISVSVSAESGTLYVTADGEYPSTGEEPYGGPISLSGGETVIQALAVGENGLVSPLAIYGYTIGGVIEPAHFADPAMEAAARAILGVDEDTMLYTNDLWNITSLSIPQEVQTYSDLAYLPYLQSLTIENGLAGEFQNLSGLNSLEELSLINCRPTEEELGVIASLPALKQLTLSGCALSTIEPLATAQGLVSLDLSGNNVRNIQVISGMSSLEHLNLTGNAVTDLSALSLLNLTELDVSYNSLNSIAPICSMPTLHTLDVSHNALTSLGAVNNLTQLTELSTAYNNLTEVSALAQCLELTDLDLSHNGITDLAALSPLVKLVNFNFSYNQVPEIPAFGKDSALVIIDGSHNLLSTLEPLAGMSHLNKVLMDYNDAIESVDCLSTCRNLYQVNVFGTHVLDASVLTEMSIIVNYDPTSIRDDGSGD